MSHDRPHTPASEALEAEIPVLVFLSGSRRGDVVRLGGVRLCIGTDAGCEVRIPLDTAPLPLPHHATLERRGETYEIIAAPGAGLWVNGEPTDRLVLASGDVIEVGRDGAILRFHLMPEGFTVAEASATAGGGAWGTAPFSAPSTSRSSAAPSRRFRALTIAALVALGGLTLVQTWRGRQLERRLAGELERVEGLSQLLSRSEDARVGGEALEAVLEQIEETSVRVGALEAQAGAPARVVAEVGRATLFLQGSYRFLQEQSGEPLRMVLGPNGRPLTNYLGHPALSPEGDGPPLEIFVTGTGFVATSDGLILTNRHVALPWHFDEAAERILASGFTAEWTRFVAFLPAVEQPFEVALVAASDEADLAVLACSAECSDMWADAPHLGLADEPPRAGEAVVVLGYPLGLRALLARSDAAFVSTLRDEGVDDFFEQAVRIARAGYMAPLASRGIVGQVTDASVVYDAETTSGGSGGPVISLDGEVVAVNSAILPEFGGSNLGVPVAHARALLLRAGGGS